MFGFIRSDKTPVEPLTLFFQTGIPTRNFFQINLRLILKIMSKRSLLLEEFLSFSVSSKGGSTGHMLNPGQFFPNAKKFTSNSWIMRQTEPDETTEIGKLYKQSNHPLMRLLKKSGNLGSPGLKI